jgi:hypothetical protein
VILNSVVTEVRRMVQDTLSPQRYDDATILGFANQALQRICAYRPDLFSTVATLSCNPGTVYQTAPSDSARIMEVFNVVAGGAVKEVNRETMDQMYPSWVSDAAGPCVNWMRHPRNPNRFFIYPQAPSGQELQIEYAQSPPTYTGVQTVALLPDAYFPAVVDCTVWLLESVDSEHVNSGRAQMFKDQFLQGLGLTVQSKPVTDTEPGGLPAEEVL